MTMRYVYIPLPNKFTQVLPAPWEFNNPNTHDPAVAGVVFADLLDSTGASTGLEFEVTTALASTGGAGSWADGTSDIHGIPVAIWRGAWVPANSSFDGVMQISNFLPGQTGTLTTSGHANQATRDTDFILNGGTPARYDATAKPPSAPIDIAFTADGSGNLSITTNYTTIQSYCNFLILAYDPDSVASIDSIDQLITGQTSTAEFSVAFAPDDFSVTGDTITKTAAATIVDADTATFVPPQWVDGETAVKIGGVSVKASDGVDETSGFGATLSMEYFHPDDATVVEFTAVELTSVSPDSLSVVMGFSPPWAIGTQVLYDATRFTVGLDGVVSGSYTGVSYMWDRDPDDKIARRTTLTTDSGEIISAERGLTSVGLVSRGLVLRGLVMRGL